jgi:hypothetical protein
MIEVEVRHDDDICLEGLQSWSRTADPAQVAEALAHDRICEDATTADRNGRRGVSPPGDRYGAH